MTYRHILPCILFLILTLAACSPSKDTVAGKYTAKGNDTEVVLTLKENGRGTWSTDMDEISFKWSIRKGGQLWLHTKEGGVVQGELVEGRIKLTLPGVDELVFSPQ